MAEDKVITVHEHLHPAPEDIPFLVECGVFEQMWLQCGDPSDEYEQKHLQVKKEYTVLRGGEGVFLDFRLDDPDGPGTEYTVEFSYAGVTDVFTWKKWRQPREWSPRRPIWTPDPVGGDEDVMVTMAVIPMKRPPATKVTHSR